MRSTCVGILFSNQIFGAPCVERELQISCDACISSLWRTFAIYVYVTLSAVISFFKRVLSASSIHGGVCIVEFLNHSKSLKI